MVATGLTPNPKTPAWTPVHAPAVLAPNLKSTQAVDARDSARATTNAHLTTQILVLEEDRARLAQELHDEVGYRITAALLRLDQALLRCATDDSRDELSAVRQLLSECAEGVHDVAFHLRPRVLRDLGLLPAVLGLARRAQAVSGVPVSASARGESSRLHPDIELAAFRIVQEAIANALKYSSATRITIRIMQRAATLTVVVSDNGVGFDPSLVDDTVREHCGLRGMHERASLVGGRLDVRTALGCGTIVRARFGLGKAAS